MGRRHSLPHAQLCAVVMVLWAVLGLLVRAQEEEPMPERRLLDLDPSWWEQRGESDPAGVLFDCPSCADPGAGHSILVPWKGPSPFPSGHVWRLDSAADFAVLTLSPSVNLDLGGGCKFHGWIQGGMVRW